MSTEEIRTLYQSEIFVAFDIVLRGGRVFRVQTRDHIWVTPFGIVHVIEPDGEHRVFDRMRIESLDYQEH